MYSQKKKKLVYFEMKVPFMNMILSNLGHVTYTIDKDIIKIIIKKLLWNSEDVESQTYNKMNVMIKCVHT